MEAARYQLRHDLREANEERLYELVVAHVEDLEVPEVRQALRNPYLSTRVVQVLLESHRLRSAYEVRRELAVHPRTPEAFALRFVAGLYWCDLARVGADIATRPPIRRAADRALAGRLSRLAMGERISIARNCGPGAMAVLRHDPRAPVIVALLENPRLTEGILTPLASSDSAPPEALAMILRHRRWGVRYELRRTICRNRRAPSDAVLAALPFLRKQDLASVAHDHRLASTVRQRARLLAGLEEKHGSSLV